jgi:NADH:ubiquinone oxidoreductase subunit D
MEETLLDFDLRDKEEYIINMGPQHPSTHGVLRFEVCLQGEQIKYLRPHCGYIHRGIEKMSEALTYPQLVHLTHTLTMKPWHFVLRMRWVLKSVIV